jgi:DNA-binding MurR/RpiR family transcriptional regulator
MQQKTLIKLRPNLTRLSQTAPPTLAAFAIWVLDHYDEVAFSSIRSLADKANVNANTVTRLSKELGYDGYDAFRADVQLALRARTIGYAARAEALRNRDGGDVYSEMIAANRANAEAVFSPEMLRLIEQCVPTLLVARRIYAVGVRSCYSIAHYLSYVGGMAFNNFVSVPAQPGSILDQLSRAGPEDIVIAISFEHYSTEVIRATQIARDVGARVLSITDSHASPIAAGAWRVVPLPMEGPQFMPSINAALIVAELLLAGMMARSADAVANIKSFEDRIEKFGGYQRGAPVSG